MGPVKPTLALCVFGVFVLVYFSLWKGVRSAGKVVWVTALAPYVVLIILLIRGVSLPGADEGIRYYLTPEWHKLKNSKVIICEEKLINAGKCESWLPLTLTLFLLFDLFAGVDRCRITDILLVGPRFRDTFSTIQLQ